MEGYKVRYKNSKFSNQKIELDGNSFNHCDFEDCIIILERGETELSGCSFKNCKLMLKGNAYTVGRIIKLFTRESPFKVLDMEEPLFGKSDSSSKNPSTASSAKKIIQRKELEGKDHVIKDANNS